MKNLKNDEYVIGVIIGEALLTSGAETYRVEDTVTRIICSLGVDIVNVYATFTSIMVSIENKGQQPFTYIRTIYSRSVNLGRISKLNELSRKIVDKSISVDKATLEIEKIKVHSEYSIPFKVLSAGIIAFSFGFVFTSSLKYACLSFIVGTLNQILLYKLKVFKLSLLITNIILGSSLATLSLLLALLFENTTADQIIVGAVMTLVPGVIITNAMRDTESGHYISALTEMLDATLIALGIACGVAFILNLWVSIMGGI